MTNERVQEIPIGGIIPKAGNSEEYRTGDWRSSNLFGTKKDAFTASYAGFLSDTAIIVEDGR